MATASGVTCRGDFDRHPSEGPLPRGAPRIGEEFRRLPDAVASDVMCRMVVVPGVMVMPVATAVKRGTPVHVYDEKGRQMMTIPAGNKPEDGLTGYTSTTVSVRRGGLVYTSDEKGRQISVTSAR